jgi:glucan 1,3-beta-glucosidase
MYWVSLIAACSLVASVSAEVLDIPEVDHVVSAALSEFSVYKDYHGPTGTAAAKVAAATAGVQHAQLVADPAYWLADITHQGNAPFAGSGYAVFRNVMDYGAKGE